MGSPTREKLSRRIMGFTMSSTQSWRRRGFKEPVLLLLTGYAASTPQKPGSAAPTFPSPAPGSPPFLPHSGGSGGVRGWPWAPSSHSLNPQSSLVKAASWSHSALPALGFFFESKSSSWSHQKQHEKSADLDPTPDRM